MNEKNINLKFSFSWMAIAVAVSMLALSSCADLSAIKKFSKISSESAKYVTFADDYVATIERQKRFQPENNRKLLTEISNERESQKEGILAIHKAISKYMSTMGDLAADDIIVYDDSLDQLAKQLSAVKDTDGKKVISQEDVDAFNGIAKLLAKAATDSYRQRELKTLIEGANDDLQVLILSIEKFVDEGYVPPLNNEEVAMDKYYKEMFKIAEENPPQQASVELVRNLYYEKVDNIQRKKKSAKEYIELMTKIGKGHQLLYDKRNEITSKIILANITVYQKDISSAYKVVKEL